MPPAPTSLLGVPPLTLSPAPTTTTPTAVTVTPVTTAPSGVVTAGPGAAAAGAGLGALVGGGAVTPTAPLTAPPSQPAPTPHTHGDSHYHPDLDPAMRWNGTASSYAPSGSLTADSTPGNYVAKVADDHATAQKEYNRLFLDPRTRIDDPDFGPAAAERYRNAYNAYTQAREPIMAVRDAEHRIAAVKASGANDATIKGLEGKRDALIKGTPGYDKLRENYDTAAENWEKVRAAAGGYSKGRADSVQPFAEAVDVPLTDAQRGAMRTARGGGRPGGAPGDDDKNWLQKFNSGMSDVNGTLGNVVGAQGIFGISKTFADTIYAMANGGKDQAYWTDKALSDTKGVADAVAGDVGKSLEHLRSTSKDRTDAAKFKFEPGKRTEPSKSAESLLKRPDNTVAQMTKQHPNYDKNPQQAAGQPPPLNPRDRRDKADEERERRYARQNMV